MKKVKTWLPMFPGFYNTIFEADEEQEFYSINEARTEKGYSEINFDDVEWNYKDYEQSIVESYTANVQDLLKEFVKSMEVEKIVSPREYNFSNDSVNIVAEINEKSIEKYVRENLKEFEAYLKSHYKSYGGFASFHSYDSDDWLNDFADTLGDEHKVGSVLQFIAENMVDNSEFDMWVLDENEAYPYAENYDEVMTGLNTDDVLKIFKHYGVSMSDYQLAHVKSELDDIDKNYAEILKVFNHYYVVMSEYQKSRIKADIELIA